MIYIIKLFRTDCGCLSRYNNVGYFNNLEEAMEAVKNNDSDISDSGFYHYAAVAGVEEGLYSMAKTETWFQWDINEKKYREIERPKELEYLALII